MKKILSFLLCVCMALGATSCANEYGIFDKNTQSENLVDLSFFSKDGHAVTRTALASDGNSVIWKASDVIGIGYQGTPKEETKPFKTYKTGNIARFYGKAEDNKPVYFAIYPYQQTAKISYHSKTIATFKYTLSNKQVAIANTFDPQANKSVALIPKPEENFKAYNLGGLLKFKFTGSSNVKQVTLLSINQEPLSGSFESKVVFDGNKAISTLTNKVVSGSPVLTYKPEAGSFEEETPYYIALPVTTLQNGLTLAFVLNNGKAVQYKVRSAITIKRGEIKDLGKITIDESKAKEHILKNQALIDAVAKKVPGLVREVDGHLDLYREDNFEKILSYKGELKIDNQDNLTSLDELQYYRNVTGVAFTNNKNLEGKLDFSKYPQLIDRITVSGSPKVTSVDVTGLDKLTQFTATYLDNLTEVTVKGNSKLEAISVYYNAKLQGLDASNLPELKHIKTFYSPKVEYIKTEGSPKLLNVNASSNVSLKSFPNLSENKEIVEFLASGSQLESLDFSNQTKLKTINLTSAKTKELKGLAVSGATLTDLQLSYALISSLDISGNPELINLDLYNTKVTKVDISANKKLGTLRTSLSPLEELILGDNTSLKSLDISHCRLSTLDITKLTALNKIYAGQQTQKANPGILQSMTVYYSATQKTVLDPVIDDSRDPKKAATEGTNAGATYVVKN